MPWSAKAQELLKTQYAAVGSAAAAAVAATLPVLETAAARYATAGGDGLADLVIRQRQRLTRVNRYVDSYRRYCWPVESVSDLKLRRFTCWPARATSMWIGTISGICERWPVWLMQPRKRR